MSAERRTTNASGHRPPRLAVVGQFRMLVEALAPALVDAGRVRTVALETSLSTTSARDAVLRVKADVVVLVLDGRDTIDAHGLVAALARSGQRVVVTGAEGGPEVTRELLSAGAAACHAHGIPELCRLVSIVARRRPWPIAPVASIVEEPAPESERRIRRNLGSLTVAEARILWRIMHGKSVAEIARAHVVSVETVRSQIRTLLSKMETPSKLAAVAQAWSVGWQPAPAILAAA